MLRRCNWSGCSLVTWSVAGSLPPPPRVIEEPQLMAGPKVQLLGVPWSDSPDRPKSSVIGWLATLLLLAGGQLYDSARLSSSVWLQARGDHSRTVGDPRGAPFVSGVWARTISLPTEPRALGQLSQVPRLLRQSLRARRVIIFGVSLRAGARSTGAVRQCCIASSRGITLPLNCDGLPRIESRLRLPLWGRGLRERLVAFKTLATVVLRLICASPGRLQPSPGSIEAARPGCYGAAGVP